MMYGVGGVRQISHRLLAPEISTSLQVTVFVEGVRQTARIVSLVPNPVLPQASGEATFEFMARPEAVAVSLASLLLLGGP